MKVLHVTPSYYPAIQFGGPVRSVHALNSELIRLGVEVDVVTTNAGLVGRSDIFLNKKTKVENVPVTYFPFWGYEHYNFSIPLLLYVFKQVKHYDVVHITAVWNFPVLATALSCIWHKKPYVLSPRGTLYPETINHRSGRFKKIYYKFIAGMPVKKANLLHFTSKDESERVMSSLNLKNKYITLYNGIPFPEITIQESITKGPYLLFIGRIDKKKGLDILIKAYSKFIVLFPEYTLIIAGPDNEGYLSKLKELCIENNVEKYVKFTGEVEGNQKWNLYYHAKLFILSSYSENFGMTVGESMLLKCPVIISDQVGLSEAIEQQDAGWVCKTNTDSLLSKMIEAMQSESIRKEKAERAYVYAKEQFDIKSIASKFVSAYSTLLSPK